jgi:hypothetical protein
MGDPTTWFAVIIAAALCPLTLQSPPIRSRLTGWRAATGDAVFILELLQ